MPRRTLGLLPAVSIALLMPLWVSQSSTQAQPSRTVLTIHWGPEDFPGTHVLDAAIQEACLSPADRPVHYYAEYLETEEFPSEAASLAFRDYIRRKFAGTPNRRGHCGSVLQRCSLHSVIAQSFFQECRSSSWQVQCRR